MITIIVYTIAILAGLIASWAIARLFWELVTDRD